MVLRNKIEKISGSILFFLVMTILGYFFLSVEDSVKGIGMNNKKRIFLMGASVGKEWNLSKYPERMKTDQVFFESAAVYQYDKSEALEELLIRPKRRFHLTRTYLKGFFKPAPQLPDTIIIKECAAYFPGDLGQYKDLLKVWVKMIRDKKIEAVLATVVPVTREQAEKEPEKIGAIRKYNDWIREYANKENLLLLDLEYVVRTDDNNRFLKEEYSSGDGLHLNQKAYDMLDRLIQEAFKIKASA